MCSRRNELQLAINNGDRGRVLAVTPISTGSSARAARSSPPPGFLQARTGYGDATVLHGYAITCHVAQGLTVDEAFVLADRGITQESGYTALSRGRHADYLTRRDSPTTSTPRSARSSQ
jgi:hypothetical protein